MGSELRVARASAGLTLDQVAHAVGISASELSRIERGLAGWVGLATLNRIASIVGIDLWVRTYPGGEPLRDLAHLRLTQAFTELVGPSLTIRSEVSIGDARDQRAWDLTLTDLQHRVCGTELETRLVDAQSQMRRTNKKRTDSNVDRLLVVLADTRSNRSALRAAAALMATDLSIDDAAAYAALCRGELPPRDALILVRSPLATGCPDCRAASAGDANWMAETTNAARRQRSPDLAAHASNVPCESFRRRLLPSHGIRPRPRRLGAAHHLAKTTQASKSGPGTGPL